MRPLSMLSATMVLAAVVPSAFAQGPLEKLAPGKQQETLPRLANDQIEGTIWEYKAKPKDPPKEGQEVETLEGKFRTEGSAIFDISKRIGLPEKKKVEKTVEAVKSGKAKEIKLPSPPQQKRIGEYHTLNSTKLRLDFNDPESLNGVMVVWKKKKTDDVLLGTFTQKEGKKTVKEWIVEIRPIED
ncbi:MAG: hypothetical protein IT428_28005 [Planctomycetaceae bacterium]|nr:hypothetical protein [Planctomycetaceae bacterium]